MDIIIRKREISGIPLLELSDTAGEKRPLVLMFHGYGDRKECLIAQAYYLTTQGFAVVLPDVWGHGERFDGAISDFFESVARTADEVDTLLDHFKNEPYADAERAGITGYSMGGCIVYEYISRPSPGVKAAVPIIATPDWAALMARPATAKLYMEYGLVGSDKEMAHLISKAEAVQPLHRLQAVTGLPLLMLNGSQDPLMPAGTVEAFYGRMHPLYTDGEALKLSVHPNTGHADTVWMNMEMADWFRKYL